MLINKGRVIEILRDRGQFARADWVAKSLPDEFDSVKNAGLLVTLRLDQADLSASEVAQPADAVEPETVEAQSEQQV